MFSFKDIQQLKIAELKQQIAQIRNQQQILDNPVNELQDKLSALEKLFKRGKSAYHGQQKFNFWEKHFTQRNNYKQYQAWLQNYQDLPLQIENLKKRINMHKQFIEVETEDLERTVEILNREIIRVKAATNLAELGIEPQVAAEMLQQQAAKAGENYDSGGEVFSSVEKNDEPIKQQVKDHKVNHEQQTVRANNGTRSFFIDSNKLITLVKRIRGMGFYEAVAFANQVKPELDKLVMLDGVDHDVASGISQIEAFETKIYQAAGLRPTKIEHTPYKYGATNTAKDIVVRIIANAIIQTPVYAVEAEPSKVKPEERTL